jgi:hypothetical protein
MGRVHDRNVEETGTARGDCRYLNQTRSVALKICIFGMPLSVAFSKGHF